MSKIKITVFIVMAAMFFTGCASMYNMKKWQGLKDRQFSLDAFAIAYMPYKDEKKSEAQKKRILSLAVENFPVDEVAKAIEEKFNIKISTDAFKTAKEEIKSGAKLKLIELDVIHRYILEWHNPQKSKNSLTISYNDVTSGPFSMTRKNVLSEYVINLQVQGKLAFIANENFDTDVTKDEEIINALKNKVVPSLKKKLDEIK